MRAASGIGLDLNFCRDTKLGTLYAKGGWWRSDEGKVEQTNAFFLPGGMELVMLACAREDWCGWLGR